MHPDLQRRGCDVLPFSLPTDERSGQQNTFATMSNTADSRNSSCLCVISRSIVRPQSQNQSKLRKIIRVGTVPMCLRLLLTTTSFLNHFFGSQETRSPLIAV